MLIGDGWMRQGASWAAGVVPEFNARGGAQSIVHFQHQLLVTAQPACGHTSSAYSWQPVVHGWVLASPSQPMKSRSGNSQTTPFAQRPLVDYGQSDQLSSPVPINMTTG